MPRKVIPLETGEIYHVFNRGVDKRNIFEDKIDITRFHSYLRLFNTVDPVESLFRLSLLKNQTNEKPEPLVSIGSYCLLPNHYHLILKQSRDGGISEFMKRIGGGYTSFFNERYERSGSLFQGTFKRVHVESDKQLNYLAAYVNHNNIVHDLSEKMLVRSSLKTLTGEFYDTSIDMNLVSLIRKNTSGQQYLNNSLTLAKEIRAKRLHSKDYEKGTLLE